MGEFHGILTTILLGDIRNTPPREVYMNGGGMSKDKYKVTWAGIVSGGTVPKE